MVTNKKEDAKSSVFTHEGRSAQRWMFRESKFVFLCATLGGILAYLGVTFDLLTYYQYYGTHVDKERVIAVLLIPYLLLIGYRIVRIVFHNAHESKEEKPNQEINRTSKDHERP